MAPERCVAGLKQPWVAFEQAMKHIAENRTTFVLLNEEFLCKVVWLGCMELDTAWHALIGISGSLGADSIISVCMFDHTLAQAHACRCTHLPPVLMLKKRKAFFTEV